MLSLNVQKFAAFLTVAALTACGPGADGAPAQAERPPQPVGVVVAQSAPVLLTDRLPGRVVAYRRAEVRPQVAGLVEQRLFEEGAVVAEGQQLYQIDPRTYEAALSAAQADLARAEATFALNQKKLKRYKELLASKATSRQTYEDTVAAEAESRAAVAAARARVRATTIDVTNTKVTAPISGIIGRSQVSEGALVTANQAAPMTTITQLDPIYVDLTQSSSKLMEVRRRIASGELQATDSVPVTLVLNGAGDTYPYQGRVRLSEVLVDEATDSVTLRAVFPNPDKILLPGMFVRADVAQGRLEQGILVPQKAIARAPNGDAFVWIVGEGDTVARRSVVLDRAVGADWLVKKGLVEGDRVIVEGIAKIRDGVPVAPKPAGAAPDAAPQAAASGH